MSLSPTSSLRPGSSTNRPAAFLTFTLHAHLPYVVNHGTWPHGMEWLHEAAAETYLPLLRVLANLERDGIALNCNLNLSPILLEQLAHPVFKAEFPKYLERKIVAAREDEAYFTSAGEAHYGETARFWVRFFSETLRHFEALDRDIIRGFREFNDKGLIEIITCGATHGYMPLLGTDESVRAQVRTAVQVHERHIGKRPRGIWAPECGYRPAGFWNYPATDNEGSAPAPGFDRIGVEQALSESGIGFFFVDTHLVEESSRGWSPYERPYHDPALHAQKPDAQRPNVQQVGPQEHDTQEPLSQKERRRLYQPYYVDGPDGANSAVTVFPRDPRTGLQVWSGDWGYPGDGDYLDFHKKRWPGGHRYWRVTGSRVDIGNKQPYAPQNAAERVKHHAHHFVDLVRDALRGGFHDKVPPILCSPFDAELFGHWWFEGPLWLEAVARAIHASSSGLKLVTCSQYLDQFPRAGFIKMQEGSWGAEGSNHVWMNPETAWTYSHLYPAELYLREVCTAGRWKDGALGERIVKQLCRELLLLESSDWQFLITTGAARDYAELRFETHHSQFNELKAMWQQMEAGGEITEDQQTRLAFIELRDSVFPEIHPGFWAAGARDDHNVAAIRAEASALHVQGGAMGHPGGDSSLTEIPKFLSHLLP